MKIKFDTRQLIDESGTINWNETTYDGYFFGKDGTKVPASHIEEIKKDDSFHFSVKNRPIIQLVDNNLASSIKISELIIPFNAVIKYDNGFSFVSFEDGDKLVLKRGIGIVEGYYIDFIHKIEKGKKYIIETDLKIFFPTVVLENTYFFQLDKEGNFWADPTPDEGKMIFGKADFKIDSDNNGYWENYVDLRSYWGKGDETKTDVIANKLISNYFAYLNTSHLERLDYLENNENQITRNKINQIARDLYESGQFESGFPIQDLESGYSFEERINDLESNLAKNENILLETRLKAPDYKRNLDRANSLIAQNDLIDINQQVELDYISANLTINADIYTETFLKSPSNDIESGHPFFGTEDLSEIKTTNPGLNVYRYRDLENKNEIKGGLLKNKEEIVFPSSSFTNLVSNSSYIEYGERFYPEEQYANKTYILPKKFVAIGSKNKIQIFDMTDEQNIFLFMDFIGTTTNALPSIVSNNYEYMFKFHKDILYVSYGIPRLNIATLDVITTEHCLLVINFKDNSISKISGTVDSATIRQYNSSDCLRERNLSKGFSDLFQLQNVILKLFAVEDLCVSEIDGKTYCCTVRTDYEFNSYLNIFNLTDNKVFCIDGSTGSDWTAALKKVKINDNKNLYVLDNKKFTIIEDISLINSNDTLSNYKKKIKIKELPSSSVLASSLMIAFDFSNEYDYYGKIKNTFTYISVNNTAGRNIIIKLNSNEMTFSFIYDGTISGYHYKNIYIKDDFMLAEFVSTDSSPSSGGLYLISLKENRFDSLMTKAISMSSNGFSNSVLTKNFVFSSASVSGAGFYKYKDYPSYSWYEKKDISINPKTKKTYVAMSENSEEGYLTTMVNDDNPNIEYSVDIFSWSQGYESGFLGGDYHSKPNNGYLKYSFSNQSYVGVVTPFIDSVYQNKFDIYVAENIESGFDIVSEEWEYESGIYDESGYPDGYLSGHDAPPPGISGVDYGTWKKVEVLLNNIEELAEYHQEVNLVEGSDSKKRLVWIPYELDKSKQYTIKLKFTTGGNPVRFDGFAFIKVLEKNIKEIQFSTDNGNNWIALEDHVENFLVKEQDIMDYGINESGIESGFEVNQLDGEWLDGNTYRINYATNGIQKITAVHPPGKHLQVTHSYDENNRTELIRFFDYDITPQDIDHSLEPITDPTTTIKFKNGCLDDAIDLKIYWYIKPTIGKLRIKVKQPNDESGYFDKNADVYISDFGLYFME
jgi:hypothetical protein